MAGVETKDFASAILPTTEDDENEGLPRGRTGERSFFGQPSSESDGAGEPPAGEEEEEVSQDQQEEAPQDQEDAASQDQKEESVGSQEDGSFVSAEEGSHQKVEDQPLDVVQEEPEEDDDGDDHLNVLT